MDNVVDMIMRIDKRKEILTLWYEVTYLRMIISQIVPPEVILTLDLEKIKNDAQEMVRKRFPEAELSFSERKL